MLHFSSGSGIHPKLIKAKQHSINPQKRLPNPIQK